jgi:imidazolonepropionase-like amidohydrolase
MEHWAVAPANAALLREAGIPIAFSASGLKSPSQFVSALSKAVRAGMPSQEAFRAITEVPARWLGIWDEAGSLELGKLANVLICSDTLFSEKWNIESCFVQGQFFQIKPQITGDLAGSYELSLNGRKYASAIKNEAGKFTIEISDTGKVIKINPEISGSRFDFMIREKGPFYLHRFNGNVSAGNSQVTITGLAFNTEGIAQPFVFSKTGNQIQVDKKEPAATSVSADDFVNRYPFHAFGNESLPVAETILFKGADIWTAAENSSAFKGDILVSNGKIIACAENVNPAEYKINGAVRIISAEGKHISPGIIDEHSHIAVEHGVNEGSQNNTAEVRIGDAVTSEDPAIYYQLMGGVTSAQLLHGSANPVGGQSAIIKLRWGETPAGMINRDAPGHIKFALGENVKQSNWGDNKTLRFPQTRMGVEQVYYDAFERARAYMIAKEAEKKKKTKDSTPLREDLELEAIQEIIEGKRFITCHSYVQSEVNMLMHVADSMGFKVNTFTHILEGYKVADKLASHGANASTFSDWWAYKFEVNDAIPHNAALLTRAGVNTGINSDDAEMGRRLNQEAAKAVLYGGLSEMEALKLVTINPAKMLHIDKTTGSIEPGKDADLVVWSDHPLSIRARAELTMIDGKVYFDLNKHDSLMLDIKEMRTSLISKLLSEKPEEGQKVVKKKRHQYHCDDLYHGELYEEEEL